MAKIRKQTYTMSMFMEYVRDKDIRDDADVQRSGGQWTSEQVNELLVTVLTDGYIPPIFLGEDRNKQKWLIDGLQRSTSLKMYRYGNYRVTSAIRNSVIRYRAKLKEDNGNLLKDKNGNIIWEETEFDIRNKTYEELPDELKKQFNSFQIDAVIFEECTMEKMSELIQIYNNHTPMNTSQKAFTYISNFARDVRDILESRFFADCSDYTEKEKIKGVTERVVLESVMCMFHLDDWKKQAKQIGIYLNRNSSKEEFEKLSGYLRRLENVVTDDVKDIFNSKDSFIWLTLFDRFSDLCMADARFIEFLRAFKAGLRNKAVEGQLFDEVDKGKGTKDKAVIVAKLHILEALLHEFLCVKEADLEECDVLEFVRENINPRIMKDDIGFHCDNLRAWTVGIAEDSRLNDKKNLPSMLAIAVYAFEQEEACDDETMIAWFADYEGRNKMYLLNQKENYFHMKRDLECAIAEKEMKSA